MNFSDDPEFRDHQITKVIERRTGDGDPFGWEVETDDSFWIGVPADSPVEPQVGSTIRLFGKGLGYCVRGMLIDQQLVYFRSESEDELYQKEQRYGRDCAEVIRRWDGEVPGHPGVWSIELGGLGPGYEQCIQIMGFEMLRYLVNEVKDPATVDWDDRDKVKAVSDAAEASIKQVIEHIGPSGAQFGAALNLAFVFFRHGPVKAMEMVEDKDRHIQVSKNFPSMDALVA